MLLRVNPLIQLSFVESQQIGHTKKIKQKGNFVGDKSKGEEDVQNKEVQVNLNETSQITIVEKQFVKIPV